MRLTDSHSDSNRASQATRHTAERTRISIGRLVNELVLSISEHLTSGNITVELDVQPLEALADVNLIRHGLQGLLHEALQSMPNGGELSVTLIDGSHQWELEVADTSSNRLVEAAIDKQSVAESSRATALSLPWSQAQKTDQETGLRAAYAAAEAHGGHLQSWDCPAGGVANVLVIPKAYTNTKAA